MPPSEAGALEVLRTLRARGHRAYFAGGCVRDRLLKVAPKDWDIATDARPEQVQGAFPLTEPVGAAFGVVLVIHQGAAYEVASFRTDGRYLDGRRPESVSYGGPEEDARRRDFTVNGLFYDPEGDEVLDYVGGRADLEAGVLRAIGDPSQRFEEDRLRVLRCLRFACQLGFKIEDATWSAVRAYADKLQGLAMERVAAELTRLLTSPRPRPGLELLDSSGLLQALLPELLPLKGCPQPPEFHPEGDAWQHTLLTLEHLRREGEPTPALAWGALLHDVAKPATLTHTDRLRFHGHEVEGGKMARAILGRFKLPGHVIEGAAILVEDHLRLGPIREMKLATLKRLLRRPDFEELLALHKADCLASHGGLELYDYARARRAEFDAASEKEGLRPPALLDGKDLIAWGYSPGPLFKTILAAAEEEQLEGRLADKDAARDFVRLRFPLPEPTVPAGKPASRRPLLWLLPLLILPLALILSRFAVLKLDRKRAEALALAELAKPQPQANAWGVLGSIRLEQGRLAEALPLLEKAAALEAHSRRDTRDSLTLAKAHIKAAKAGLAEASRERAAEALRQAEGLTLGLAKGKQAATFFSAGKAWLELGRREEGRMDLRRAVALQPDDWVDEGKGLRYKSVGLSAYYQKMLAAALEP